MNLFKDFIDGVVSGFASAASEWTSANPASAAAESCCQQLCWSIDERPNARQMVLHFKDPLIRIRKLLMTFGDQGVYVGFTVFSAACIPARQVTAAVLDYLLERNDRPFVGWQICTGDDDDVGFALTYFAIAAGLRPEIFKLICETMIQEAHEFDARMDKAGVLR